MTMPAFRGVKNESAEIQIQVTLHHCAARLKKRSSDKTACIPYPVPSQPQILHLAGPWFAERAVQGPVC